MQTQVCWFPNPVLFPLPLEELAGRGSSALTSHPPPLHIPCGKTGQALGPYPDPHSFPSPTASSYFPSLHSKAWLPSPRVLRPQGQVLRLQHGQLVGSKALSTTGKALMTLPTAKVLMSFPPHPDLKLAPSMLKPGKVGLELYLIPWRVVLSSGVGAEGQTEGRGLIISLSLPSFTPRLLFPCIFEAPTLEVPHGLCPLKLDLFLAPTGKSKPKASSRPDSATNPGRAEAYPEKRLSFPKPLTLILTSRTLWTRGAIRVEKPLF